MRVYDETSGRWLDTSQPIGETLLCGSIVCIVLVANVISRDLKQQPEPHQTWCPPRQEDEWDPRFEEEWTSIRSTDISYEGQSVSYTHVTLPTILRV